MPYNSMYGNFRTRKFTDIFSDFESFNNEFVNTPFKDAISTSDLTITFYLLYARFGNSHIANSDENQFKYKLFSTLYSYGPTWAKKTEIQKKLRNLNEDEVIQGAKQIYNHAYNPGTVPSTSSLEELKGINDQNTANYKRSKIEAYESLWDVLEDDIDKLYMDKFKFLFISIVEPQTPLWYVSDEEV